jgi:hypothetical protein
MAHISWNMDGFSKLEAVFIPNFAGHRFAQEGRWVPAQYSDMLSRAESGIFSIANTRFGNMLSSPMASLLDVDALFEGVRNKMLTHFSNGLAPPSTGGINYFQSGLRFTTTIGPVDLGVQYFYGNLFRPDFTIAGVDGFLDALSSPINIFSFITTGNLDFVNPNLLSPQIKYNRYHQVGLDYAQVVLGFNLRAEAAIHLTTDLKGDDGSVRNPFIGWSLGFDRDLFWGINANIQCNETVRLFNSKVGNNPVLDCEADTKLTSTRLTMRLSKKFFKDELESSVTAIWGVEDMDCYIIPSFVWTIGNFSTELCGGVFAGKESGELGQYWRNSFVRLGVKYTF